LTKSVKCSTELHWMDQYLSK